MLAGGWNNPEAAVFNGFLDLGSVFAKFEEVVFFFDSFVFAVMVGTDTLGMARGMARRKRPN